MKNVIKLSEQELKSGNKTSWHDQYRNSAWIFIGGLPYDLSEGTKFEATLQCNLMISVYRRRHLRVFTIWGSRERESSKRQENRKAKGILFPVL